MKFTYTNTGTNQVKIDHRIEGQQYGQPADGEDGGTNNPFTETFVEPGQSVEISAADGWTRIREMGLGAPASQPDWSTLGA